MSLSESVLLVGKKNPTSHRDRADGFSGLMYLFIHLFVYLFPTSKQQ